MKYIFEVNISAEKSNFLVDDCILGNWRFSWSNNKITAYIFGNSSVKNKKDIGSGFDYLATPDKLGFLIDVLCFCTDLPISTKTDYKLYEYDSKVNINLLDNKITWLQICQKVKNLRCAENGDSINDWPVRINLGTSHTFKNEKIEFIKFLLNCFSKIKVKNNSIKLLNYWRRGFDLDVLFYWDESFLVFFKILEYFEKKYNHGDNLSLDKEIEKNQSSKIMKKALRITGGAKVSNIWNLHDHIKELARWRFVFFGKDLINLLL